MKNIYLLIVVGWLGSLYLIFNYGEKNVERLLIASVKDNERKVTKLLDIAIAYNNSIKEQLISNLYSNQHLGESPLLKKLTNYPELNAYGLDFDVSVSHIPYKANLTGKGKVSELSEDALAEINAVLWLNFSAPVESAERQFKWSYYTSLNGFMVLSPRLDISEFNFSDFYYSRPFWQVAIPENNPQKGTVISDLFEDSAAPGLIVSISTPVYYKDNFRGIVTLDVGLDYINSVLRSSVLSAQDNMSLITKEGKIISSNKMDQLDEVNFTINDDSKYYQLVEYSGNYYILSNLINGKFHVIYQLSSYDLKLLVLENIYNWLAIIILLLITLLLFAKMITLYQETKKLAEFDGLSNLYNRMTLESLSERLIEAAHEHGETVSVIMADIDFFKDINDKFGHHVGDKGIVHVASIIQKSIRKTDLAGRYGGEEFVITVPNCDLEMATGFAERIRSEVEKTAFHKNIKIKLSLGIAESKPGAKASFQELCKKADLALYKAKADGRNRAVQYHEDLEKSNKRYKKYKV